MRQTNCIWFKILIRADGTSINFMFSSLTLFDDGTEFIEMAIEDDDSHIAFHSRVCVQKICVNKLNA